MKHLLNNLTEEEKNAIREQHKDVININTAKFNKLIESRLGDVKPMVNEQAAVPQNKAWDGLKNAIEGMGTDEDGVKSACAMITTPQIYQQVLAAAKKEGYKTVMDYILTDFDTIADQPVRTERTIGTNYNQWMHDEELGGLWSKDTDTQTCLFCAKTMNKFNRAEFEALWNGTRVDKAV